MMPLLRPTDSCVLLVDPRVRHLSQFHAVPQAYPARRLRLVLDAAHAGAVPVHLAFAGGPPEPHDAISPWGTLPAAHMHVLGGEGLSWSSAGIHAAVRAQNRGSLVLAGFWLETTVTFLALPALAAGFDVFVLMDVSPASDEAAAGPAASRLICAGAVSATAHQLVAEWSESSTDPKVRAALASLLPTD